MAGDSRDPRSRPTPPSPPAPSPYEVPSECATNPHAASSRARSSSARTPSFERAKRLEVLVEVGTQPQRVALDEPRRLVAAPVLGQAKLGVARARADVDPRDPRVAPRAGGERELDHVDAMQGTRWRSAGVASRGAPSRPLRSATCAPIRGWRSCRSRSRPRAGAPPRGPRFRSPRCEGDRSSRRGAGGTRPSRRHRRPIRSGACRSTDGEASRRPGRRPPAADERHEKRRVGQEDEPPAGAQKAPRLRDPLVRVAPKARPVLGDGEVEARIRQRHLFGVAVNEREVQAVLGLHPASGGELLLGVVDADGLGAAPREPGRDVGGPAAELDRRPSPRRRRGSSRRRPRARPRSPRSLRRRSSCARRSRRTPSPTHPSGPGCGERTPGAPRPVRSRGVARLSASAALLGLDLAVLRRRVRHERVEEARGRFGDLVRRRARTPRRSPGRAWSNPRSCARTEGRRRGPPRRSRVARSCGGCGYFDTCDSG